MIYNNLNRTGQIEEIKTKNDKEIVEVYGGIGENNPIYYKKTTMEGVAPLSFKALGQPLTNYTIYGAGGVGDRTENLFETLPQYLLAENWERVKYPEGDKYYFMFSQIPNEITEILKQKLVISGKVFLKQGGIYYNGMVFAITPVKAGVVSNSYRLLQNDGNTLNYSADVSDWENIYLCIGLGQGILENTKQTLIDSLFNNYNISLISGTESPNDFEPYGYKIPITCGGITTNIYRNKPICNESLSYSETEVQIPTTVGQNILSIDTTVQPDQATIEYKEPAKTTQGVAPLTFTSDGSPLSDYTIYGYTSPNLFDASATLVDSGIDRDTGEIVESSGSLVSDWIAYDSEKSLFISGQRTVAAVTSVIFAFYDSEKNYIDWVGVAFSSGQYSYEVTEIPDSAAFFRVQFFDDGFSNVMINQGDSALPYEIYGKVGDRTENLLSIEYFLNNMESSSLNTNTKYIELHLLPNTFYCLSSNFYDAVTSSWFITLPNAAPSSLSNGVNSDRRFATVETGDDGKLWIWGRTKRAMPSGIGIPITEMTAIDYVMLNRGSTPIPYEPYGYKIPITCGGETTNIYLDSPLYEGDSISLSTAGVEIPTVEGENTLTVGTTVQPSNIEISYKEPSKILTDSLPLTFTSDGSPLINYVIYDNSVGVGDRTENLFDYTHQERYHLGIKGDTADKEIVTYLSSAVYVIPIESNATYWAQIVTRRPLQYFRLFFLDYNPPLAGQTAYDIVTLKNNVINPILTRENSNYPFLGVQIEGNYVDNYGTEGLMVYKGDSPIQYEPYGYKIPVTCGGETTNIYLDSPLYEGDSISFSTAQTTIPTMVGQNALSIGTTVQPSKVLIEGNIKT